MKLIKGSAADGDDRLEEFKAKAMAAMKPKSDNIRKGSNGSARSQKDSLIDLQAVNANIAA